MEQNVSLFPQSFVEYLILFIIIVGVFLIAWFYSKLLNTKRISDELKRYENENQRLKQTYRSHNEEINLKENNAIIRAKRTRNRFGVLAEDSSPSQLALDWSANNKKIPTPRKDDLTQLKELDATVEKKLNELGVFSYVQISKLTIEDVSALNERLSIPIHRIQKWIDNVNEYHVDEAPEEDES